MSAERTCDGRVAPGTLLRVERAEALDAVGAVPLRGEGLAGQRGLAPRAHEALFMPHLVLIGHAPFGQGLSIRETERDCNGYDVVKDVKSSAV